MKELIEELWDEAEDFFEDFFEHLLKRKPKEPFRKKEVIVGGAVTVVRPAYLFAERIDNLLRIVFGVSILVSAITASFLGFSSLSDLFDVLIFTLWGRVIMLVIGASYLIISLWKMMHLGKTL